MANRSTIDRRRRMTDEVVRLADIAIFGTLSETYRTCGQPGCSCRTRGLKHGPHLNVSYRGSDGKTTGFYVPKDAQDVIRAGNAAWTRIQELLRILADLNKDRVLAATPRVRRRKLVQKPARSEVAEFRNSL